jgi:hypothetical protein
VRRATGLIIAVAILATIGITGWWAIDRFAEDETEALPEDEIQLTAVRVTRTDLVDRETLEATLRYGDPGIVYAQAAGTITALPEPGALLGRGDTAFEIDGQPVIVMWGEKPAWRPLSEESAAGADVRQLEGNLVLFGFSDDDLEVDEEFTAITTELVEQWQADLGLEETGIVELGRVLFLPQARRVADLLVEVGATVAPGVPVLATSAARQEVQLWLDADRQDLLAVGDTVGLELPDEVVTTGVVTAISDVVSSVGTGPEARRVFEVTIRLEDPGAASGLDEAPVDVEVVSEEATDVLVVPVNALLALAEGGYAVQLQEPDGSTLFIPVDIGKFADGVVEIRGELAEGDLVMVPR